MPPVKKKKSREEKLAQEREKKREKRKEIKNDPEKYAIEKEKERLRYLKRKEQKKIKSIKDLTPRHQRTQRKKWRESHRRYLEKKKIASAVEQMLVDNSPPSSDEELVELGAQELPRENDQVDPLEGPSSADAHNDAEITKDQSPKKKCKGCSNKQQLLRRYRYSYCKQIGLLKSKLDKQKKQNITLRKLLHKAKLVKKNNPSTVEKVENLIENIEEDKREEVKKKLMFGEILKKQLNQGFQSIKKKDKRQFSDVVVKDRQIFKKHKVLSETKSFTVREQKEADADKNEDKYQEIQDFFDDDSNSRIAADKKEWIKRGGVTKQKRYLTDNLLILHKKYNATHSNQVGYSTFCKHRPFWVLYPKESDRNTCSCIVHVNFDLIIKALNKNKILKESNGSALLESLCCDIRREECLNRTCSTCKNKLIEYGEFQNDKPVKYFQWGKKTETYTVNGEEKTTKKTTKTELQDLPLKLIKKLDGSLPRYFKHCLNIVQQYKSINDLKRSITPNEVLIHMDFSENYITKFHEEVQSRHFGSSPEQISLHTSVAYLLDPETGINRTVSMCTMSDCTRHDAESVWAHVIPIIENVKSITFVDTLHFLTDSPSSQYRNRKIFYIISQLQQLFPDLKLITWNYMESGHGKGAPDGIGAVVKRTADSCVTFGRDIGTLKDFEIVMKERVKNVEMRIVSRKDIEERKTPEKMDSFKGTMSVHQVLWSSNSLRMTFRNLSCFFCPNGIECNHGYHLGFMDVPEENVAPAQVQVLQDFIDENTTPELLDEITNSPKRLDNVVRDTSKTIMQTDRPKLIFEKDSTFSVKQSGTSTSPKVKILSEIPLDFSNRFFSGEPKKSKYQSDFEKFITTSEDKDEDLEDKTTAYETKGKENSEDDEDESIF